MVSQSSFSGCSPIQVTNVIVEERISWSSPLSSYWVFQTRISCFLPRHDTSELSRWLCALALDGTDANGYCGYGNHCLWESANWVRHDQDNEKTHLYTPVLLDEIMRRVMSGSATTPRTLSYGDQNDHVHLSRSSFKKKKELCLHSNMWTSTHGVPLTAVPYVWLTHWRAMVIFLAIWRLNSGAKLGFYNTQHWYTVDI